MKAFKANYDLNAVKGSDLIQLTLASVKANGSPKIQPVVFQDFLKSDSRVLIFAAATRNAELMSVVKVSQTHELCWQFPKTRETFTLSGRLFIVCASSVSHRYGSIPRNITLPTDIPPGTSAQDFWESERLRLWKRLNPAYRASWTWPSSGEPRNGNRHANPEWTSINKDYAASNTLSRSSTIVGAPGSYNPGFKFTRLDAMDDKGKNSVMSIVSALTSSTGNLSVNGGSNAPMSKDDELKCAHNIALDNFCILVFKIARVDHYNPSTSTPTRRLHACTKEGTWLSEDVNP
ncbi:hypothetical protein HDV05_003097 [Chytridiales sp. JEL 0842]|nr:hypothetical protein HDV05_003097 [Chytridiales sp. JEL 0842]